MGIKEREQLINKTKDWLITEEGKQALIKSWEKAQRDIIKIEQDSYIDRESFRNFIAI